MAFAAIGLGSLLWGTHWDDLTRFGGPLGLVALAGYAALWLPSVEVSEGGVTLHNVLRTVRLPWTAIEEIDGRYGLRLTTTYGRFTAWAAPAPAGRDRTRGGDSDASALVRGQLERLRGLGHLESPRLESSEADVTWHVLTIAMGLSLLAITVAGPLLT